LEATTESELVGLRKIHNSLKDEMGSREAYFKVAPAEPSEMLGDLPEGLKGGAK
jgi:hypothetical protein